MKNSLSDRAAGMRQRRRRWRTWEKIVCVLSAVVVFCTTYALILPAITAEKQLICGKEEHTHDESCYTKVLICGYEEGQEIITEIPDPDYAARPVCGKEEHIHTAECYDDGGNLICGKEEHIHTEKCYESEPVLVCGKEEHTHTDECYETQKVLTCGKEEHTHGDECYDAEGNLICGKEEHIHTEECYEEQKVLICGKEEHTHDESCYAVPQPPMIKQVTYHHHTDECYELRLTCGKEEHIHTEECCKKEDEPAALSLITLHTRTGDGEGLAVSVTGMLPEGAAVRAVPVEMPPEFEDDAGDVLFALDISIVLPDGSVYEPPEGSMNVEISSPEINAGQCDIYYVPDTGTPEDMNAAAKDGSVSFETPHFSTYVGIRSVPQQNIVVEEGDIVYPDTYPAGTAGQPTGVHWKLTQDQNGIYTMTFSGSGPIPDFTFRNTINHVYIDDNRPWAQYRTTNMNVIIENGITCIGEETFRDMYPDDVQIGAGVTEIRRNAFAWLHGEMTSIVIPGNVKTIGKHAFNNSRITAIELQEGVETIQENAFYNCRLTGAIAIPASLREYSSIQTYFKATAYNVAADSPYFTSVDGVMYTKDMTELVAYPELKYADVYTVPASVTKIRQGAFEFIENTRKIVIPNTVTSVPRGLLHCSYVDELVIEDGTHIDLTNGWFHAGTINKVTFPKDSAFPIDYLFYEGRRNNPESLTIPNKVTRIGYQTSGTVASLTELIYDAEDAAVQRDNGQQFTEPVFPGARYALTIGRDADVLRSGFKWISCNADSIAFEGPNRFTVESGAFESAPDPFKLEGEFYADANGALYRLDTENHTAKLIYVPDGCVNLTVPATFTADGDTFTVNKVTKDALKYAGRLAQMSFDSPQTVVLEAYALANCPTLTKINDAQTIEAATALFGQNNVGHNAFYNTGLTGAGNPGSFAQEMSGSEALTVTAEGAPDMGISVASSGNTMQWTPQGTGTAGGYKLLTGDTMTFTASVGNTAGVHGENFVYRVYAQKTGGDCIVSLNPGTTYTFDGHEATCYTTADPNTVCLEFVPGAGETISIPITAVYSSPQSAGGGLTVWGEIKDKQSNVGGQNLCIEPSADAQKIQSSWRTDPDPFSLEKTGAANSVSVTSTMENGNVAIRPTANLVWTVKLNRTHEETDVYGKDYSSSVDFEDRITLPEDFEWDSKVKAAAKNGQVSVREGVFYVDGEKIFSVNKTAAMSGLRVTWDDTTDSPVIRWNWRNLDAATEIDAMNVTLNLFPKAIRLKTGVTFDENKNVQVHNKADAKVHYTHSADEEKIAEADNSLVGGRGALSLRKTGTAPTYFGEDITYTVTVYNNGALPWHGDDGKNYKVEDFLSDRGYISFENMERMFGEAATNNTPLTITIQYASLAPYVEVTAADGTSTSYQNSGNSDIGGANITVTVTKNGDNYSVAVTGNDTPFENASLAEAMKAAGFADTLQTVYTCSWALGEGTAATFGTGEEKVFHVYANAKDSFKSVTKDWPNEYPNENKVTVQNNARIYAYEGNNKTGLGSANASCSVKREAVINKSVSKNGADMSRAPSAENGDVLDYKLAFDHFGNGEYHDLPMVDTVTGSQYLLVPVTGNEALAGSGLETYTDSENVQYYKLAPGDGGAQKSYTNVKVGIDGQGTLLNAACITVQAIPDDEEHQNQGLSTTIKWYYKELPGEDYRKTVEYKTLVDTGLTNNWAWSLGNKVWMNDKTDHRIYDALWGAGTIIDFEKKIVETKGVNPASDVVYEDNYSVVGHGESVTYRIKLYNKGDYEYTLLGSDLGDGLPNTFGKFAWTKGTGGSAGNVVLTEIKNEAGATLTKIENDWTISAEAPTGVVGDGRQFIRWPNDAKIVFPASGSVYLYFTLTFPDNTGTNSTWSEYATAVGGTLIDNTLYVYRFPSNVTHDLKETGKAALQKGVLSLSWYGNGQIVSGGGTDYAFHINTNSSRRYYNNKDSHPRYVSYYVTVYNGGINRLYLSDIYDDLPDGFKFRKLSTSLSDPGPGYEDTYICTGVEGFAQLPTGVRLKSASITAHKNDTPLHFTVGAGRGDNAIKYDERQGMFYLNKDEAIVFAYLCEIGEAADTEDIAANTVGMHYTDNLNAGVVVPTENEFFCSANNPEGKCSDNNDGNCTVQQSNQVETACGFPDTDGEWLVSGVRLLRGRIIPGVTKFTESYTDTSNHIVPYANSAPQNAVINWKARLNNSGTLSVTDYTFTDIMPAPYIFTGKVSAKLYSADKILLAEKDYFEVLSVSTNENNQVIVRIKVLAKDTQTHNQEQEIVVGGDALQLTYTHAPYPVVAEISFTRDGENLKLILHVTDPRMSITEAGGYLDMYVSGKNPTSNYNNAVYTNKADFKPNAQPFTEVSKGSGIKNERGDLIYVTNSAPVTVAFGYATGSEKAVTEKDTDPENTAVSTDPDNNTILLSAADKGFTYTLTVDNTTEKAMTKLVLIDSLPDIGDTSPFEADAPRNSEFKVNFAAEPNVTVKVIDADNHETTLESSQYTVQYSTSTDFGGVQSADWKGENSGTTATWENSSANARSIKIIIKDDAGTLIPANSRIEVSFDAVADGTAEPGTVAWNSFGYHYALKDEPNELEAMPLPVGVKVPSVPKIKKQLTDLNENPYTAAEEMTFTFRISDNSSPTNTKDMTVTIPEGQSEAVVVLDNTVMNGTGDTGNGGDDSNGSSEPWVWDSSKTYTVEEIHVPENWKLGTWTGGTAVSDGKLTFSYDPATNLILTCTNISQNWELTVKKIERDSNPENLLSGAVFALYSPDQEDAMADEAYNALGIDLKPKKTLTIGEGSDEAIWYLTGVKTTGDSEENLGKIVWKDLTRESYYLVEVKAPDGYYLEPEPILVTRNGSAVEITAENRKGFVLPKNGGRGNHIYTFSGLLIMAAALMCFGYSARRKKKRRGGV